LVDALARVGFKEVYRLTGFAAVAQLADQRLPLYGLAGAQLRENSLLTGLVMETLAPAAGVDARMAYTAGLLRSIGKIAMDRMLKDDAVGLNSATDATPLAEWETRLAGLNNCAAAAIIMSEWRFPEDMSLAIRDHYLLDGSGSSSALATLLNISAGEAARAGCGLPGESSYWELTPEKLAAAGLDEKQLRAATAEACANFEAVRAVVA
jgi:HD-like signal output (HDOD) protein